MARRHRDKKKTESQERTKPTAMAKLEIFLVFFFIAIVLALVGTANHKREAEFLTQTNGNTAPVKSSPKNYDAVFERVLKKLSQEQMLKARDKLKVLVESHPDSSISQDLNRLIVSSKVFLNFEETFSSNAVASVMWIKTSSHGEVLTLQAPASWVLESKHSDKAKQLIIFHEYQHIRQQLDGTAPRWLAYGVKNGAVVPASHAEQWFEAEYQAYEAEAQLAMRLGWQSEIDLCQAYATKGRRGLRHAMAAAYSAMPEHAAHAQLFAQLAER